MRYIPLIMYVIFATILVVLMYYYNNLDVYGHDAMTAAAKFAVYWFLFLIDAGMCVIHTVILLILHFIKKRKKK